MNIIIQYVNDINTVYVMVSYWYSLWGFICSHAHVSTYTHSHAHTHVRIDTQHTFADACIANNTHVHYTGINKYTVTYTQQMHTPLVATHKSIPCTGA